MSTAAAGAISSSLIATTKGDKCRLAQESLNSLTKVGEEFLGPVGDTDFMSVAPLNSIPRAVPVERRNARRIQVQLPIEVEVEGQARIGQIVELSRTGARIAAKDSKAGASVVIRRAGVEVRGRIVWANGLVAGIRFPEPLAESDFVQLRRRTVG